MIGNEQATCARTEVPRAERIAQMNDALRRTGRGGVIIMTRGVRALPDFNLASLLAALADYDQFDEDSDPHGERDFGLLDHAQRELLWKIDYFDVTLTWGSDDPADPEKTMRVLTILLAEEY